MPKWLEVRCTAYADGLSAVERWLEENCPGARALRETELKPYSLRDIVAGWGMSVQFADGVHELHLLLDNRFPRTCPQVAMADHPPLFTWPHVQEDGMLCLLPDSAVVDSSDPSGVVSHIFGLACQLIEELIAGKRLEEFQDEFLSYWGRKAKGIRVFSLIAPNGPSRIIYVWRGSEFYLVAESEGELRKWLVNYLPGKRNEIKVEQACLIWLSKPLLPNEYPDTPQDMFAIGQAAGSEIILQDIAGKHPEKLFVLLGMESKNGPCFAGTVLELPPQDKGHRNDKRSAVDRGFRVGKTPQRVISNRFFAGTGLIRSCVERVDASWVHGRGQDIRADKLMHLTVNVIGCGSIGSAVASMLAQAGVGNLVLIDPERLSSANTGRHALAGQELGQWKAESLATRLKADFPHLQSVVAYNMAWQDLPMGTSKLLNSSDVIVSAIGHWSDESELNEWHLHGGRSRPIVYGWTEPYACSGHAVAVLPRGGCLQCGFAASGIPKLKVASFGGSTVLTEPACGVVYQPYSVIELTHTVVLISELAIDCLLGEIDESVHRIWAGRSSLVKSSGGEWTAEWLQIAKDRTTGGFVEERKWNISADCRECQTTRTP